MLEGVGRRRLIDVARGDVEPDLVIENARVFSVFTTRVARRRRRGRRRPRRGARQLRRAGSGSTPGGRYLVPGFIDAHVHIESSKLMVDEFARVGAGARHDRGRRRSARDRQRARHRRHPLAARRLRRRAARRLGDGLVVRAGEPLRVAAPAALDRRSRVGAAPPARARRRRDDELPGRHRAAIPTSCASSTLRGATHVDGHAPGVRGHQLDAYLAAGHPLGSRVDDATRRRSRSAARAPGC